MIKNKVRPATAADLDEVIRMQKQLVKEDIIHCLVVDTKSYLKKKVGPYFLVSEDQGRLTGFIYGTIHTNKDLCVIPKNKKYLELDEIYVKPGYRGKGTGSVLLAGLLKAARSRGVKRSLIFSGAKDVRKIMNFYGRFGYRSWGVQLFK